jgi:hypothetical protein
MCIIYIITPMGSHYADFVSYKLKVSHRRHIYNVYCIKCHTESVNMFIIYPHTNLYLPSSNNSLIITINLRAEYILSPATMLHYTKKIVKT